MSSTNGLADGSSLHCGVNATFKASDFPHPFETDCFRSVSTSARRCMRGDPVLLIEIQYVGSFIWIIELKK